MLLATRPAGHELRIIRSSRLSPRCVGSSARAGPRIAARVGGVREKRPLRVVRGLASHGLLRSSGWLLFGASLARAATLAASVVVARIVAPAQFGQLTLIQTAVTLLSGLAASAVPS